MPISTEAIVARGGASEWEIEEVLLEDPQANEILVEMIASGLCHTDLHAGLGVFQNPLPCILGHEGVGKVKVLGSQVTHLAVGDVVVLTFSSCRKECKSCQNGAPAYCTRSEQLNFSGKRLDGTFCASDAQGKPLHAKFFGQSSFSRIALVDSASAVRIRDHDPNSVKQLVLGCGFQTGAGAILNACQISPGSTIVIWGCGGVGLAAIMAAATVQAKHIIAVDVQDERLQLAQSLGATHIISSGHESQESQHDAIMRITDGQGIDFALDCVGSPAVLADAQKLMAPQGTLLTVGGGDANPEIFIPKLIDLWQRGQFPFIKLLRYYRFEDFQQAVDDMRAGVTIKPVLVF